MVILIHLTGELRVTDQVPITIKDQEIWATDNRNGNATEICFASKFALINDSDTISDRTDRPLKPLVWWNGAQVFISAECGEMSFLMPLTQSLENLLKRARFGCWDVLLAQVHSERTYCGSIQGEDVGGGESHGISQPFPIRVHRLLWNHLGLMNFSNGPVLLRFKSLGEDNATIQS